LDESVGRAAASLSELRSARRLTRRKNRTAAGRFLAEGPQAVREALRTVGCAQCLLVSRSNVEKHRELTMAAATAGVAVRITADDALASLTDTSTPQGVVAICRMVDRSLADALGTHPALVVCCARVRDPGNAGTVIRCADAFGADAVVLSEGSVDAYNSKAVRSSAGSLFHVPLVLGAALSEVVSAARAKGLQVLAADGGGLSDLDQLNVSGGLAGPCLWLFGNEAWGLPAADAALCDQRVRVPIYGAAESLNLAAAAAVCLYATSTAQRRAGFGFRSQTDSRAEPVRF
jgi:RNA methyltransferase, TrmH family